MCMMVRMWFNISLQNHLHKLKQNLKHNGDGVNTEDDCVDMEYNNMYKWNDNRCPSEFSYICEKN